MFKKLKEKITEEVKISPQRFVDFTQSVSDRLQNSSTSDDNFFSIGDDDANSSVDNNSYGFSSVQLVSPSQEITRKNSTSSLASDISFLHRYEPGSMYHLQSDLDISASEVEDNTSTNSSQLGHLSKEQIYSAFQKAQTRYHKYRGRYTDLTKHYKNLEREIMKMKSVLVETQDKSIRRITELKEQCGLEQKAKAHLESALRDELDEKNYKIKTLQTQIGLLQSERITNNLVNVEDNPSNSPENLESLNKYLNDARKEIEKLNAKIQELKANAIVYQSKEQEYKSKISNLEKDIVQFSEREKENNLNLAQNKMELHNEILLKDSEISTLKRDNETIKQKLELLETENKSNSNQKMENLQSQNKKLIEKVESLNQKSNNLESELIKMQTFKIEIDTFKQKNQELEEQINELCMQNAELNDLHTQLNETSQREREEVENQIQQLREDAKKGLLSLEPKIRSKIEAEFSKKEEEIQNQFKVKLEELTFNSNTTKDIELHLLEKDNYIKKISEQLNETYTELVNKKDAYTELEKNHLDLIQESTKCRDTISNLEKDKLENDTQKEKISRLEAHINTLQEELKSSTNNKGTTVEELYDFKEKLANSFAQLDILKDKNSQLQSLNNQNALELKKLEKDKIQIESENELLNKKISELKQNLEVEKGISEERINLEKKLKESDERVRLLELKQNSAYLEKDKSELLELKLKELEETLKSNLEAVEKEQESISKDLDSIRKELIANEDDQFSQHGLQLKLKLLKDLCNMQYKEYNELKEENVCKRAQIEQLESEISNIQDINKDFVINIQDLQNSINKNKNILEEKETSANNLTNKLEENQKRIQELEKLLRLEEDKFCSLSKENDQLETKLKELDENYRLSEIKQESLEMEKSSCHILQMKLNKLEDEYQKLQEQYENNKISFENISKENGDTIKKLQKEVSETKKQYENKKTNFDKKLETLEDTIKQLEEDKYKEVQDFITANEKLRIEKEETDKEISKLLETINKLNSTIENQNKTFNALLTKAEESDEIIEKIRNEKEDTLKQQNLLQLKINELEPKCSEISTLKQRISELESQIKSMHSDLRTKDQELYILIAEKDSLIEEISTLRGEIEEFTNEISHRGNIDTKLTRSENEKEELKVEQAKNIQEISELNIRIQQLSLDNMNIMEENQVLTREKEELKYALHELKSEPKIGPDLEKINLALNNTVEELKIKINELNEENNSLKNARNLLMSNELDITKIQQDFYEIKAKCDDLFTENKSLKLEYTSLEEKCNSFGKIKKKLETQISDLERHYNELLREKELLSDEVQELKTAPMNYRNDNSRLDHLETLKKEQSFLTDSEKQHYHRELETLREKLTKYKSLDLTNKSSIEFYENELQKVKNQNDKLNRKLDETLVTLNHCAELSTSTEVEYLRNVLYNYMLGKESLVLARVIAAVCKFDPQQTELILQKEQQKQTLLGQLGLI